MKVKALKSFTGRVRMIKGEVREVEDEAIAKDLVSCGYAIDLEEKQKEAAEVKATSKAKGKKGGA